RRYDGCPGRKIRHAAWFLTRRFLTHDRHQTRLQATHCLPEQEHDFVHPGDVMTRIANPGFAEQVSASFDRQNAMHLIRATLPVVEHGQTEIHVPHWDGIEQQHGFVHGGIVGMIADSAAGYAAMTLVPAGASVLSVEYKINMVAPADGQNLIARGRVVRPGRTLIITSAEVFAGNEGQETLCALMQQTIMVMHGKAEK